MKHLVIAFLSLLLSTACSLEVRAKNEAEAKDQDKGPYYSKGACFEAGGVEYQLGKSGGLQHVVCIFRKGK